jgi:hypothetical protein
MISYGAVILMFRASFSLIWKLQLMYVRGFQVKGLMIDEDAMRCGWIFLPFPENNNNREFFVFLSKDREKPPSVRPSVSAA